MSRLFVVALTALTACESSPEPSEAPPSPTAAASVTASVAASASAAPKTCDPACGPLRRCDAGTCVSACPKGEVYIPPTGEEGFGFRTAKGNDPGPVHHTVVLTKPFCMDATEVTVAAYATCVEAEACEAPRAWGLWSTYPKQEDHPVNKVHWDHAKTYCEHVGKALPTEAQWAWAASGGKAHMWAWGNDMPTCKHADFTIGVMESAASDDGCHGGGPSAVGSHPEGDRVWPDGRIHDLSGNVWEWIYDTHGDLPPGKVTDPAPMKAAAATHVLRGGGWNRSGRGIRIDYRGAAVHDYQVPGLGFRCVRNP